jgi:DUF4097 and DUF4098 domain-containing protein YvlB
LSGLFTLIGVTPEYPVRAESTIARTLRFSGTGVRTLDVRVLNGPIHVIGYEGADVQVEARRTIAAASDDEVKRAEREVVLDVVDNAATVEASVRELDHPACGDSGNVRAPAWWDRRQYEVTFDLTIRVPRDVRLRLCAINGGVQVDDVAAEFDVNSVNGRITLGRMAAAGRAVAVNGAVEATFVAPPHAASLFKTVNGAIVATFPADLSADVRMKTFSGGLFTDFDGEIQKSAPVASRRDGKFVYRSHEFTTLRVGRGGPELTFDAFNGDVRVLRASH